METYTNSYDIEAVMQANYNTNKLVFIEGAILESVLISFPGFLSCFFNIGLCCIFVHFRNTYFVFYLDINTYYLALVMIK